MVKRTSSVERKFKPSQAAIDAWHAGDLWALHAACGLAPWEFSPLPENFGTYGLPESAPDNPETAMDLSWEKVRHIQEQLYALAVSRERHDMILIQAANNAAKPFNCRQKEEAPHSARIGASKNGGSAA
jgi:hypothetical protein